MKKQSTTSGADEAPHTFDEPDESALPIEDDEDETPHEAFEAADLATVRAGLVKFSERTREAKPLTAAEERELDQLAEVAGRLNLGAGDRAKATHPYQVAGSEAERVRAVGRRLVNLFERFVADLRGTHTVKLSSGHSETFPNLANPMIRDGIGSEGRQLVATLDKLIGEREEVKEKIERDFEKRLASLTRCLEIPEFAILVDTYVTIVEHDLYARATGLRHSLKSAVRSMARLNNLGAIFTHSLPRDYRELQRRGAIR